MLLVDRIVVNWIYLHFMELNQMATGGVRGGERRQRQIDRLHRRYINSDKALAVARRMAVRILVARVAQVQRQAG